MVTIEELREKYADVINDEAIRAVSTWTEKNFDDKFTPEDEEEYVQRASVQSKEVVRMMKRIVSSI